MLIDPFTQREFNPKRSNQKFECSENRIAYHNAKANEFRRKTKQVFSSIANNIKILDRLYYEFPNKLFHKEYLRGLGFSFNHFSSITQSEGKRVFIIHCYGIIPKDAECFQIVIIK